MTSAKTLTSPDQSHTALFGAVHVQAQLTVDGGVTITAWTGPDRANAVSFSYTDLDHGRRRYAQIRQLARTGLTAEQIDAQVNGDGNHAVEQVRQLLNEVCEQAQADPSPAAGVLSAAVADVQLAWSPKLERDRDAELVARFWNRPAGPPHGQCLAGEEDEPTVDEVAPDEGAGTVAAPDAQPRTLAELARVYRATHPQVRTLAQIRAERAAKARAAR